MRVVQVGLAILIALALGAAGVAAQETGHPARGLDAAQRLCAQCHAIGREQPLSPNLNAPPFAAIASVPGMTAIALRASLNTSHRTMPNIVLEAEDQADIIAYILSLR
jgi:mono/diheme cytochrome c family protein